MSSSQDSIFSLVRRILIGAVFFFGVSASCYVLFRAADSVGFRFPDSLDPTSRFSYGFDDNNNSITHPHRYGLSPCQPP